MWSQPVVFVHEKRGLQSIKSSFEALQILDSWWTKVDGAAYKNAIIVCVSAMQGERTHEDARAAFISALIEGDIDLAPVEKS
ncbi:DUF982 domain-containing protein [Falsirhodobacter xinxiangensis]|uniref:DUF982 domain-containing protein n=1 Tax=Falsirhodobacter xinxiangensis TaxID=2530049 RepID=UPI0010AAEEC9|nr:DUF982 domain-containing protein [Rhodobacter xinxiangensis]